MKGLRSAAPMAMRQIGGVLLGRMSPLMATLAKGGASVLGLGMDRKRRRKMGPKRRRVVVRGSADIVLG